MHVFKVYNLICLDLYICLLVFTFQLSILFNVSKYNSNSVIQTILRIPSKFHRCQGQNGAFIGDQIVLLYNLGSNIKKIK